VGDLLSRFDDLRRRQPNRPLIYLPASDSTRSAAAIWDAQRRCAERLAAAGVASGRLVLSAVGNSPASVELLLACRTLDAAVMPVDGCATPTEIHQLAERFGAAAIVTPSAIGSVEWTPRSYPTAAVLKLTSGSTGAPKATLTTEAQLVADATHIVAAMDIRPDDVQIAAIPVSHSYGLGNLMLPLLMQGTAFVLRDSFIPHQLPDDARRVGARVFPGVPFMFEYFLAQAPAGGWPPTLARLSSAGAPLHPATAREFHARFGVAIHAFYGSSETGGISYDDADNPDDAGTVGRLLPGVVVTLRPADCGLRIHVASDAVSSGYSDGDCEDFVDGGFLTGDYGTFDARQRLMLTGRVSSFINVAGRKVQPEEVEQVLRDMPGVADVRVVAAPDERRGEQLVACVVSANASLPTPLDVRRHCAARLAPHKIPRSIVFLDAIPLTARGKTDRAALDDLVRTRLRP